MPDSKPRLHHHLQSLCAPRNPVRHLQAHAKTRAYLKQKLQAMGRAVQEQEFSTTLVDTDGLSVKGVNVLGEAKEDPSVIVVAHYDTVDDSPGADDNLSAVAVALEVAARCTGAHVLFPDLEESGLLGARHFVSTGKWLGLSAIVLESVGYWSREDGSQSFPGVFPAVFPEQYKWLQDRRCRGDFLALLHLPQDRDLAYSLQNNLGSNSLRLEVPEAMLLHAGGQALRDFGRSDHLAFWEQGRSCLMLTDSANFRNPNYHRPTDTLDTLDLDALAVLVDQLCDWCLSLPVG